MATSKSIVFWEHLQAAITDLWNRMSIGLAKKVNSSTYVSGMAGKADTDHTHTEFDDLQKQIDDIPNAHTKGTYSDLKEWRNNNELVAGTWYRMTDFVTTIANDDEARSAGHQFDLLLLATSENSFSQLARAIKHTGDTYFANANLAAWQVWYCIDNDTTRFQWADEDNGKGVIYRLIDEWGNDYPYDFKNVQFKRYKVTDSRSRINDLYLGYAGMSLSYLTNNSSDYKWCYTFNALPMLDDGSKDYDYNNMTDASLNTSYVDPDGGGYAHPILLCNDHKIEPYNVTSTIDNTQYVVQTLNNIVQWSKEKYFSDNDTYEMEHSARNVFGINAYNISLWGAIANTFGCACHDLVAGGGFTSNTFGNYCRYNSFGNDCNSNSFGNNCWYNSFGNDCNSNTFGNYCRYNSFGNSCWYNSFGNDCNSNSFGNYCNSNTFGDSCWYNSFGNNCWYNSFGNDCNSNTFGDDCNSNSFGNYCRYNSFGNYIRKLTVFDGVMYVSVTGGTSSSAYVQNAQILNGLQGTDSNNLLTITFTANVSYTQVAGRTTSGNLTIFNPCD